MTLAQFRACLEQCMERLWYKRYGRGIEEVWKRYGRGMEEVWKNCRLKRVTQ
jgi:hypothetical protein